jgi:succinoglycan biosynthesis transport protein ExoP
MAQEIKGFAEHFDGFTRHLKLAGAVFAAILVIGIVFAYSLPDIYQSQGYILIEEPQIPSEILKSTITSYASQQLATLNEKILTIPNIIRFIEEFDLYPRERLDTPVELLVPKARAAIAVEIQSRSSVNTAGLPAQRVVGFTVAFEDESPETAKRVADALVEMYLEENLKSRSAQTRDTAAFLAEEVKKLEGEIGELEAKLATFKEENANRLPSLNSMNMQQMQRTDEQLMTLKAQLDSLEQTRISVEAQLVGLEPTNPVRLADGTFALAPADQLKQLQTQLSVYQSRYSDNHPDVKATKRDIESLKSRFGLQVNVAGIEKEIVDVKGQLAVAQEKYGPEHPDVVLLNRRLADLENQSTDALQKQLESEVKPDNPAYIQLRSTLDSIDAQEDATKTVIAKLRSDMAMYEQRLTETPQVESEFAALSRTLTSTSNRYWVMRDKQFAAEMGESLETESKGEAMLLVEPPRVPLKPIKPNRGAIITLTILFALVAGIGITQLADGMDTSLRNTASIVSIQSVPPLAEIPYIYTQVELAHAAKMRKFAMASVVPVICCVVLILHFTVLPLDVLWFALASRIGL